MSYYYFKYFRQDIKLAIIFSKKNYASNNNNHNN